MPKVAYTFEVTLLGDRMPEVFIAKGQIVSRTIRIGGEYALNALHRAIFKAFDRYDEHLYEFQFGGKSPMDRNARCFQRRMLDDDFLASGEEPPGDTVLTRIDSLNLNVDDRFFYWFDFGDDWWHAIKVVGIGSVMAKESKPTVLARVGQSPPQYPDLEE